MIKYLCPICDKRACDSNKNLSIMKASQTNEKQADIIIKCHCCKNTLAVKVIQDSFIIKHVIPCERIESIS